MSDNELLLAISNMVEPIRQDIREIKQDMREMKQDIQGMKTRLQRVEMNQENNIIPRLQNIEACYTSTYDRYRNYADEMQAAFDDIAMLKKVVSEHSEKLRKIS